MKSLSVKNDNKLAEHDEMNIKNGRQLALSVCAAGLLASPAGQAGLLDDGQTTLRYANYPWIGDTRDDAEGIPTYKEGEWVHALELKYHSGYYKDWLGFDLGAYGVDTLTTKDDATRTQNIDGIDDDGYGGLNLAYLKARWNLGGIAFDAGYGKKRRTSHLYDDFNFRIIEATTVGGDLSMSGSNWNAYATMFNKSSRRNQDDFGNSLKTFLGEKIDYVGLIGGSISPLDNLTLDAEFLEAKDYIRRGYVGGSFISDLGEDRSLTWDARYGTMADAGALFESVPLGQYANDPDGLDASFNELALTYRDKQAGYYATLWRTDVNGGDFNRLLFKDDHGWWDSRTRLWQWFGLEGETSYGVTAGMDFANKGAPGLSLHATYVASDEAEGFEDFSREEFRTVAMYNFPQPALKGLSFVWLHIDHLAEGTPDGVRRTGTVAGPAALAQGTADRIYINYVKKF